MPNEIPDEHMFDERVQSQIDNELDTADGQYTDWLQDQILAQKFNDSQLKEVALKLSKVQSIRKMYSDYRFDDILADYCENYEPDNNNN